MPAFDAVPHQILCWYDTPRSAKRIAEVKAIRAKAMGGSQVIGAYSAQEQINHARRLALGTESAPDFSRQRELSASAALHDLTTRSSSTQQLTLHVVMKPTNTRSAYAKSETWTDAVVIREMPSIAALVEAVDRSGAEGLELAWGLENIANARWFINWIEMVNTSQSANSEKTTVPLDHTARGTIEFLGGNLEFQQREQRFYAQVGRLLPGERLWAVFRSRRVIDLSEIETLSDPTVFLDRRYVRGFLFFAGMIGLCWLLGNLWGRSGRHRGDLDYACGQQ